jgi:hypothetical protein
VSDERERLWFTMTGLAVLLLVVAFEVFMQRRAGGRDAQLARACYALFARGDTVAALRWDRRCLDVLPEEAR